MNNFSQSLNVYNVSVVRQIEVHMAELLVPGPSRLEFEIAIAKLMIRFSAFVRYWRKKMGVQ
jgi:hypothetical protein